MNTAAGTGADPALERRIAHIDMDAFFASIEQLDHPQWRGKPLAVGDGPRSVVSAASYEIRAYGVRSAMPVLQAKNSARTVFLCRCECGATKRFRAG